MPCEGKCFICLPLPPFVAISIYADLIDKTISCHCNGTYTVAYPLEACILVANICLHLGLVIVRVSLTVLFVNSASGY